MNKKVNGTRMDFGACLVLRTPSGAGNNVITGPGKQEARTGGAKGTMGDSNHVCYFSWFAVVPVMSP